MNNTLASASDIVPVVSVTGTKGKTTTVAVIADVLRKFGKNVLKVDTTGHFVNNERHSSLGDSKQSWRLVPSVCPGRYLWEFHDHPELREGGVAVLECSLGCSAMPGLGYRYHNIGVFLNVFEDHIGSSDRIQSQADIAKAKDFAFSRIDPDNGYAVFNADDEYVCGTLTALTERLQTPERMIPCGFTFEHFDIDAHLMAGGVAVTVHDNKVVLRTNQEDRMLIDLTKIPWTFNGTFLPSVWNIISAVGAVYAYYGGERPENTKEAFESVRLDHYGGRLTLLENKLGVKILADYAHEKVSLSMVADLARTMIKPGGNLIGVVRLAHDRSDELMCETGKIVGEAYDQLVVYEKIDGYWRQPTKTGMRFPQIIGRTSQVFADGIKVTNKNVERILREDEALVRAAEIAQPEDVVVVIVNDNIGRSIDFIKEKFNANFI